MRLEMPYGRGRISFELDDRFQLEGIIEADVVEAGDAGNIVLKALARPIGAPPLEELARGAKLVTIITPDHTRPMPSHITIPALIDEIRASSRAEIRLLVATGTHRKMTESELAERFGVDLIDRAEVVCHDCDDSSHMADLGLLSSGRPVEISRYALEADLLIAEGLVEPHFFAGYSGGPKSVLPGIASRRSIHHNHSFEMIASPKSRAGNLEGNPIYADALEAAGMAGLRFVLNVVPDGKKRLAGCFCGAVGEAHMAACRWLDKKVKKKARAADIVITGNGGYPLDQNLYQMVKCMSTAEACVKPGGVIIAAGECEGGIGGNGFLKIFERSGSHDDVMRLCTSTPAGETLPDQWQAQILARILAKAHVVLVSRKEMRDTAERFFLDFAESVKDALDASLDILGKSSASVLVIPDGIGVVVETGEAMPPAQPADTATDPTRRKK